MIFTTVKKKTEKQEAFPDVPVLTQHVFKGDKGSKTSFSFNSKAMELLGFPLNTPNVSKVAHGFDENNNLVLATTDTGDIYTSNITAKNTFSNQKFFDRICKQFGVNGLSEYYYELHLMDSVDDIKYFGLTRILASDDIENTLLDEIAKDFESLTLISQDTILPTDNFEVQESKLPEPIKTQEDIIRDVAKSW